jgi:hypothetical protein
MVTSAVMKKLEIAPKIIEFKDKQIGLKEAKDILRAITSVNHESVAMETLGEIEGFSFEQIRKAALMVSLDLVRKYQGKTSGCYTIVRKTLDENGDIIENKKIITKEKLPEMYYWRKGHNLTLDLSREWEPNPMRYSGYRAINLHYDYLTEDNWRWGSNSISREIRSSIPLIDPTNIKGDGASFRDNGSKNGEIDNINLHQGGHVYKYTFNLEDYRALFKGMRWMFANMLHWDEPRVILPEQLNQLALPENKCCLTGIRGNTSLS